MILARHQARRLAYQNAFIWALGNGLISSTLVVYLAAALNSTQFGLGVGLILAARYLVGVLQLGAPVAMRRWVPRKIFCLAGFTLSGLFLFMLPIVASPHFFPAAGYALAALVLLWSLHHLMQYLGNLAWYSWIADFVPVRIRGRFFGRRGRWLVAGEAIGALACGFFSYYWMQNHVKADAWIGYAVPAAVGAALILASVVPLYFIPPFLKITEETSRISSLHELLKPLVAPHFRRFLLFGCWLSLSNGVTQSLQYSYPINILNISLLAFLAIQTGMRAGQIGVSPALGRWADRIGNRPMMMFCLLLTAQGPLFYLASTPERPWWIVGAFVVWIAYAGLNIGLPTLMLKIAPPEEKNAYQAVFFTLSGVCYAAVTIAGGACADRWGKMAWTLAGSSWSYAEIVFIAGWLARMLGLLFLAFVIEEKTRYNKEK